MRPLAAQHALSVERWVDRRPVVGIIVKVRDLDGVVTNRNADEGDDPEERINDGHRPHRWTEHLGQIVEVLKLDDCGQQWARREVVLARGSARLVDSSVGASEASHSLAGCRVVRVSVAMDDLPLSFFAAKDGGDP